jgi:CRP-like cAMP-binding protein
MTLTVDRQFGGAAVLKDRTYLFRRFAVLKDVSQAALEDLAKSCIWQRVTPGKQIVRAKDESSDVYFITNYKVKVLIEASDGGRPVVFTKLGPYEMFGEVSAIDGEKRSATVESEGEGDIAILKRDKFMGMMRDHSDFCIAVSRLLASHVRRLSLRVQEISKLDVRERVQAELLRLAIPDIHHPNQAVVSPAPREEVAENASTGREAVSRVISELVDDGIVKREGQDLRVLDLKQLSDRVRAAKGE